MKFRDRFDAGEQLADAIGSDVEADMVVLALPRGGIPLGLIISKRYQIPFNVILSKKIGHPSHSEYAIGAVAEDGEPILNQAEIKGLDSEWLDKEIQAIREKMAQRRKQYSKYLEEISLHNKTVIIADDGIATGMTMKAAIEAAYSLNAKKIIVAVPVIPKDTYSELKKMADKVIAVEVPALFLGAVGAYYSRFPQVEDEEVIELLESYQKNIHPR